MTWIVATTFNDYRTPKRARLAYNPETGEWKVDPSLMWLMEADAKVRVPGPDSVWVTREQDPLTWLRFMPDNYYRGAYAACWMDEVASLDDLPPLQED